MNYLISYPRSGNTWLRYCVEYLTTRPTNGLIGVINPNDKLQQPLIHKDKTNYILYKKHFWDDISKDDNVIVIVRDPIECFVRHNQAHRGLSTDVFKQQMKVYMGILENYHNFEGEGLLCYYEELITDPENCLMNTLSLLGHHKYEVRRFCDRLDEHKIKALQHYPKSQSKGKDLNFHSKKLNKKRIDYFKTLIKQTYPLMTNTYLNRYL